jgi:Fe-S-cluster containining protein
MKALRVLREHGEAISARVEERVSGALGAIDPSPASMIQAAQRAYAALDAEGARLGSLVAAPACAPGCASCCHVHVEATLPEILAVAAHLVETRSPAAIAALREQLSRHVDRVASLSDEERWAARIPCALLGDEGRCTVYPARPLRCRAFHSTSAAVCRDAFEGHADTPAPQVPALQRAHEAVELGYDRALAAAGLRTAGERLEVGLLAVLRKDRIGRP